MITVGGKASFYSHLKWLWASGKTSETKGGKEEHWWFPFVQLCKSCLVSGEILWETQPSLQPGIPRGLIPHPSQSRNQATSCVRKRCTSTWQVSGAADVWGCFEPALPALIAKEQEKSKVQPIFETPHLWGCLAQATSFQFPRKKKIMKHLKIILVQGNTWANSSIPWRLRHFLWPPTAYVQVKWSSYTAEWVHTTEEVENLLQSSVSRDSVYYSESHGCLLKQSVQESLTHLCLAVNITCW